MLAKRLGRRLTLPLAAVYLASVTVAGAFHSHHGPGRCAGSSCAADHAGSYSPAVPLCCDGALKGSYLLASQAAEDATASAVCPVCQFLAQKPLPSPVVETVAVSSCTEAPIPLPSPLVLVQAQRVWRIRAPPA